MSIIPSVTVSLGGARLDSSVFMNKYRREYGIDSKTELPGLAQAHALLHDLRTLINPNGVWRHDGHEERAVACNDDPDFDMGDCKIEDSTCFADDYGVGVQTIVRGACVTVKATLLPDGECTISLQEASSRTDSAYRSLNGDTAIANRSAIFETNLNKATLPLDLVAARGTQQGKTLRQLLRRYHEPKGVLFSPLRHH